MMDITEICTPTDKTIIKLSIRKDADKFAKFCEYLRDNNVYIDESGYFVNEDGEKYDPGELYEYVEKLIKRDFVSNNNYKVEDVINALHNEHLLDERKQGLLEKRYMRKES